MPNAPLPRSLRLPACRVLGCALATLVALLSAAGCGDSSGSRPADFTGDGPFAVGNATLQLHDAARDRDLTVEVWYPATVPPGASKGAPVQDFYPPGVERERYAELLAASPDPGPSRRTRSARDAVPAREGAPWPLIVFSHCHDCTRFSSFSIAERLASHGFVVAAPDHAGNILFDERLGLNVDTLRLRAADVSFVLTALLAVSSGAEELPVELQGAFDATRAGVFGHSFGGVTTGLVLQDDARFRAGAAIAAPFENPLLPGIEMARVDEPVLFLVAREDNSITELGNQFIRDNFAATRAPSWKVEVADAGHWSFSDGLAIGESYVTAFFAAELRGEEQGRSFLAVARPPGIVDVSSRP